MEYGSFPSMNVDVSFYEPMFLSMTYIKYDKLVSGRDTFTLDENNRLMKVGNGSR